MTKGFGDSWVFFRFCEALYKVFWLFWNIYYGSEVLQSPVQSFSVSSKYCSMFFGFSKAISKISQRFIMVSRVLRGLTERISTFSKYSLKFFKICEAFLKISKIFVMVSQVLWSFNIFFWFFETVFTVSRISRSLS